MTVHFQKLDVPLSVLGESPVWSARDQCLYFVDIVSRRVQAYWPEGQRYEHWQFDQFTGSLVECRSGGLLVSLADRIVWFDPRRGLASVKTFVQLETDRPRNRLNDGKVDPWGRFWVGSMQADETARAGRLWCVTPDGQASVHRDDIGVSNSVAFDLQRRRMYFADSMTGTIQHTALDDAHMPGTWTKFAQSERGSPDGSTVDADGYLWNASWGGWRIVRYTPEGVVDRLIETPVSRPSSCTFGGPSYKTLFVTSARYNMTDREMQQEPNAGSLYSVETDDVQGLPADLFAI